MRDVSPKRGGADSNQVAAGGSESASDSGSARNKSDRGKHRGGQFLSTEEGSLGEDRQSVVVVVVEGRRGQEEKREERTDSKIKKGTQLL